MWPEGFSGNNGWAITAGEAHQNLEVKKEVEAAQIYDLLEGRVTEMFYDRAKGHIPREWVSWMKNSISTVGRGFNMHRMLREYLDHFYLPQIRTQNRLLEGDSAELKRLLRLKEQVDQWWPSVSIKDYFVRPKNEVPVAEEELALDCYVNLKGAPPDLLAVEAIHSYGHARARLEVFPLSFREKYEDEVALFKGTVLLKEPGVQEIGVRLAPNDELFRETYPEYLKWSE